MANKYTKRGDFTIATMKNQSGQWEVLVFEADAAAQTWETVLKVSEPSKEAALLTHLRLERNGWEPAEDEGTYWTKPCN